MRRWILLLALLCTGLANALEPMPFKDAEEEARFRALVAELRCVMCQNQSLADSNAMIAADLRKEVLSLMQSGKTDQQIKDFLVERYTEFVLYRPPVNERTAALWIAPIAILVIGAIVVVVVVRRRAARLTAPKESRRPNDDDRDEDW
ncbi:cytochrome c-type biogenesis protein CcmH [Pseudoxanthomonas sp. CAU 1598]|uniref:Cytochrome c-type biogenesis protein n=2 Tax=Pseudomarimonas arenosa TaxID=2774145 RepID=A0AAW3ZHQ9_9GAMM|nr:cytochrome c-type biogenesis protein [Pseudomarimonas arenosa]MBD8525323.1 cytochrome c-type biogenesis protein CcmH [Pseudomarimonas arenosa]